MYVFLFFVFFCCIAIFHRATEIVRKVVEYVSSVHEEEVPVTSHHRYCCKLNSIATVWLNYGLTFLLFTMLNFGSDLSIRLFPDNLYFKKSQ